MTALQRELRNRSFVRAVNQRIAQLAQGFPRDDGWEPTIEVFCECGRKDCAAAVRLTLSAYWAARSGPPRLIVSRAHMDAAQVSVITGRRGYALIDPASERPPRGAPDPDDERDSSPASHRAEKLLKVVAPPPLGELHSKSVEQVQPHCSTPRPSRPAR